MLPEPLHPALVHLPVALALIAPLVALGVLLAIRFAKLPAQAWVGVALLQALFAGSAWLAVRTGEAQEERVEAYVAESALEAHEESGERLAVAATAACVLALLGLIPRAGGQAARVLTAVGGLVILGLAYDTGHSGGKLVYGGGAARAYEAAPTAHPGAGEQ